MKNTARRQIAKRAKLEQIDLADRCLVHLFRGGKPMFDVMLGSLVGPQTPATKYLLFKALDFLRRHRLVSSTGKGITAKYTPTEIGIARARRAFVKGGGA